MTKRSWGTIQLGGESVISLEDGDFDRIEKACGKSFDKKQRDELEKTLNEYVYVQSLEWDQPRTRVVRKRARSLETSGAGFCEEVEQLTGDDPVSSGLRGATEDQFDSQHQRAGADFNDWLRDTLARVRLLVSIIQSVRQDLPKDQGGRDKSKTQFTSFVAGLADVYESAGGQVRVTRDRETGEYKLGDFYSFVHAVQKKLQPEFQYVGLALGKEIERSLKKRDLERGKAAKPPVDRT